MRDYLHRAAEVGPLSFAVEDIPIYLARGHAGRSAQAFVNKALVVAEVEVGFCTVIGDEHLAVLIRAHRAGVNVEIRVKLLIFDPQAALL